MSVGDLDILRQAFCNAALQKVGEFDRDKFKIDFSGNLSVRLDKYLSRLCEAANKMSAVEGDDLALKTALLMVRAHAMSLSSFFDAIVEDSEFLLRSGTWMEFPDS